MSSCESFATPASFDFAQSSLLPPPPPLLQPATSNENETPARTTSVARPILTGTNRWVIDGNMMLRGIAVLTHFK